MEPDAIIVGGSFAGLTTAYFTGAENLLILEKEKELGARQRSTCGAQVEWIEKLGAKKSILKKFDNIALHSPNGSEVQIDLPKPYCTIDYKVFCDSLSSQLKNAEIRTGTKVTGFENGRHKKILGDKEEYSSNILVDASGRGAVLASKLKPGYSDISGRAAGIETEVEYDSDSIHLYFGKKLAPGGYAWVFPTSNGMARVGIGSFRKINLLDYNKKFLDFLAIQNGHSRYHGGAIPCSGLRDPVVQDIFVVGDAAGQALPASAEGIRKAFVYGKLSGDLISKILNGELELHRALEIYKSEVLMDRRFYDNLLLVQNIAYRAPDWAWDKAIMKASQDDAVTQVLLKAYLEEDFNHVKIEIWLRFLKILRTGAKLKRRRRNECTG